MAAARAKSANEVAPGAKFVGRPPFAHPGAPTIPTTAGIPRPAQTVEDCVAVLPGVLAARRLDLVPVQVEPHDVDAELLEPVEPLVERPARREQPGVVLDPEADVRRGVSRGCVEPDQRAGTSGGEGKHAFSARLPGGTRFDTSGSC